MRKERSRVYVIQREYENISPRWIMRIKRSEWGQNPDGKELWIIVRKTSGLWYEINLFKMIIRCLQNYLCWWEFQRSFDNVLDNQTVFSQNLRYLYTPKKKYETRHRKTYLKLKTKRQKQNQGTKQKGTIHQWEYTEYASSSYICISVFHCHLSELSTIGVLTRYFFRRVLDGAATYSKRINLPKIEVVLWVMFSTWRSCICTDLKI